jgi:hypothetical protein
MGEYKKAARLVRKLNELILLPVEILQIKTKDPSIQNFLIPKILEPMKTKHNIDYNLENKEDILRAIVLRESFNEDIEKKLWNSIGWSPEKASER